MRRAKDYPRASNGSDLPVAHLHARALSVAEWWEVRMGAALLTDGKWHPLMSVGGQRLSDYQHGFQTEDGAKFGCYLGLDIHLRTANEATLPPFEEIKWREEMAAAAWLAEFYKGHFGLAPS